MKRFTTNKRPVNRFTLTILASLLGLSVNLSVAQTSNGQVTTSAAPASNRFSLRQCIDIALQNNLQVRQGQLNVQGSELQLRQAKLNRYPTANIFASQAFNAGYTVNPTTNSFVDQKINSNNIQASASMILFNGFALQNAVKQTSFGLQAAQQNLLANQNTVALTVVQNYLNVLTYEEQLAIAQRQAETSRNQLERTGKLVTAGTLAEAELYTIRAQLANDELAIVNAQNNLDLSKLALLQAMNLSATTNGSPSPGTIEVERYELPDPTVEAYPVSAQQVYEAALQVMPDVKAADLQVKADVMGVQVAKARLYPTLSLNGGLTTLYSSLGALNITQGESAEKRTGEYVTIGGTQYDVYTLAPTTLRAVPYTFSQQLKNNLNRGASIQLQIPLFNRFQNRNQITSAIITQKTSEISADNARLTLRQNIETAYTSMLAGANRYRATQIQVESLEKAFQAAESRFNAGALNSVDYNIAKNNLDTARANLVQAKFDYIFRTKILDFYQNKPLSF
ncbi:TolC family protein [Larkinella arboricola]